MFSSSKTNTETLDSMEQKKPKKWLVPTLTIALILSLATTGYFAYRNSQLGPLPEKVVQEQDMATTEFCGRVDKDIVCVSTPPGWVVLQTRDDYGISVFKDNMQGDSYGTDRFYVTPNSSAENNINYSCISKNEVEKYQNTFFHAYDKSKQIVTEDLSILGIFQHDVQSKESGGRGGFNLCFYDENQGDFKTHTPYGVIHGGSNTHYFEDGGEGIEILKSLRLGSFPEFY